MAVFKRTRKARGAWGWDATFKTPSIDIRNSAGPATRGEVHFSVSPAGLFVSCDCDKAMMYWIVRTDPERPSAKLTLTFDDARLRVKINSYTVTFRRDSDYTALRQCLADNGFLKTTERRAAFERHSRNLGWRD